MMTSLAMVAAEKNPPRRAGAVWAAGCCAAAACSGRHLRLRPGAHCPASAAPLPRIPEGRKYRMMMSST